MQAALHKPFLLRKSILDDKKTDTDSKELVLQTVERDIAVLTEGTGKITLETAQSFELKHSTNVSEFLLSAKDVIEVKPKSGTEFRITGKKTGSCYLDLIDAKGKVLKRYQFKVISLESAK